MFKCSEKTMRINAFKSQAIPKPRDIFARYGERSNPQAIKGSSEAICMSSAVIAQVSAGQKAMTEGIKKRATPLGKDLPE